MGYEVKLVIGNLFPSTPEMNQKYGISLIEIARLDLSVIGAGPLGTLVSNYIKDQKARLSEGEARIGFYGNDGNTLITEDKYGSPVAAVPLQLVAEALHQERHRAEEAGEPLYRRFQIAQALVEAILATFDTDDRQPLVACTYGH